MTEYASHPRTRCPRCNSPSPELHPAVQFEGEVQTCIDDYHLIPTNMNGQAKIDRVLAERARRGASQTAAEAP